MTFFQHLSSVSLYRRLHVHINLQQNDRGGGQVFKKHPVQQCIGFGFFSNVGTPVSISRRDRAARCLRAISGISDLAFSSTATIVYRRFRTVLFKTPSGFYLLFIRLAVETSVFIAVVNATIGLGGGGVARSRAFKNNYLFIRIAFSFNNFTFLFL